MIDLTTPQAWGLCVCVESNSLDNRSALKWMGSKHLACKDSREPPQYCGDQYTYYTIDVAFIIQMKVNVCKRTNSTYILVNMSQLCLNFIMWHKFWPLRLNIVTNCSSYDLRFFYFTLLDRHHKFVSMAILLVFIYF